MARAASVSVQHVENNTTEISSRMTTTIDFQVRTNRQQSSSVIRFEGPSMMSPDLD